MSNSTQILRTKLHRPPVTNDIVIRTGLIEYLEKNRQKPFTLVAAPAGYGKSITISQWVEDMKFEHAWISLDEENNSLPVFLQYLAYSMSSAAPEKLKEFSSMIEAADLPPVKILAHTFINEIDDISDDFILVLDDYHKINNSEIHDFVNTYLQFPPQNLHLVIITRRDPPLKLTHLRAYNRINEIRMSELCFSESEILELLKNIVQTESSVEISQKLMQQTEGWITGLRLLLLMVKKDEDLNVSLEKIQAFNPTTTNFLLEEVILNQPESIRDCILKIAIPDQFCDELVNELCFSHVKNQDADISGEDVIQILLNANLFTISLDFKGKWYRFHHLFREMLLKQLKKQLSVDEMNAYHLKVSEWFDKNDFKEAAVKHALKGQKTDLAVHLVNSYKYEMMETGQIHRLNNLIDLLPPGIIDVTPGLLTAKSLIMEYRGQLADWIGFKEKAKALLSKISIESPEINDIRGELEAIEGELYLLSGDGKSALECTGRALELLPPTATYALSYVWGTQIVSHQLVNNIEGLANISIENTQNSDFFAARIHGWYSIAYAMQGDTASLKKHAHKSIELSEKNMVPESIVYGKYFKSVAHYLLMEDDKAEPYLKSIVEDPFIARPSFLVNSAFLLSSIYIERGEVEKADQLMEFIINHTDNSKDSLVNTEAKAMQVELALKEKNLEKALLLDKQQDTYVLYPPIWFYYVSHLTPVKLKLAINTTESVSEALQLLSEIEEPLRQTNKNKILTDVLILQALALKAQTKDKEAVLKITEALSISSMGNNIRTYVDYGVEIKGLIAGLPETNENREHINIILNAIDNWDSCQQDILKNESVKKIVSLSESVMPEKLSSREMEVLNLVAQGLRNKEIAAKLFVSEDTIKKHLYNTFQKLEVTNRLQLIEKAKALDILGTN